MALKELLENDDFTVQKKSFYAKNYLLDYFEANVPSKTVNAGYSRSVYDVKEYQKTMLNLITEEINYSLYPTLTAKVPKKFFFSENAWVETVSDLPGFINSYFKDLKDAGIAPKVYDILCKDINAYYEWSLTAAKDEFDATLEIANSNPPMADPENIQIRTSPIGNGLDYIPVNNQALRQIGLE